MKGWFHIVNLYYFGVEGGMVNMLRRIGKGDF